MSEGRQSYDRDGYAIFRGVVDSELVAEARGHIAWLLERNPGSGRRRSTSSWWRTMRSGCAW